MYSVEMMFKGVESDTQFKSVEGQVVIADANLGIVEAIAAVIGNKDSVDDIIMPGAFEKSLRSSLIPRVVWGHNWNDPIGKVLEIRELSPNDPRNPPALRAAGFGSLYVKAQFNMTSERGREAFAHVKFYGADQKWSIGYKTKVARFDPERQANLLMEVDLYEVSPVLHGANHMTGTLSVKQLDHVEWEDGTGADEKSVPHTPLEMAKYFNGNYTVMAKIMAARLGGRVRVRMMEGNLVAFDHQFPGAEPKLMVAPVSIERGRLVVGDAWPAREETVYVPDDNEQYASMAVGGGCSGGCGCGGNCGKSLSAGEVKTGRVISRSNLDKIRQALSILEEVVSSAGVADDLGVKLEEVKWVELPTEPQDVADIVQKVSSIVEGYGLTYQIDTKQGKYVRIGFHPGCVDHLAKATSREIEYTDSEPVVAKLVKGELK